MWTKIFACLTFFSGIGCGGIVEAPPEDATLSENTATSGDAPPSVKPTDKKRLGNCSAGVPRESSTECPWLADERCYPTWDDACNCICPTNVKEVYCLSDFPEEGVPTEVHCNQ